MIRKTVTVLFCDLVGSTALGDNADPEVLQERMSRYHAELRAILERHGGTVEKFIGDAVMAVFGIPRTHEDDALRAVRAAHDVRAAVRALQLEIRIGVNTGEVVAGAGETLVTGDAVNVAARLEQAADAGQILLGGQTERLVRVAARTQALEPLDLKGKAEPVQAYGLLELLPDVPAFTRPIEAPFVGRTRELETLERVLAAAVAQRPQLATVVGPPGIGKSRLVRELVQRSDARVLVGRCLSYGEGITYWPLQEIASQLGELEHVLDDELAGARVAAALGEGTASSEEIAWGVRRLFETLAQERALIVVVDDIHWAEPTLLDLIEYVAAFASDVPLLLLCSARPDLFERRPEWATPQANATLVQLEPLPLEQAEQLVEELGELPLQTRRRIIEAAEGNPLFVEQLVAHQAESGNGTLEIPPTVQALLAARIDRLQAAERAVIERAAIEGRFFHRGSVQALLPAEQREGAGGHLLTLVRKELVRPDRSLLPGDDGFRFGHILIRDAAYDSIPKRLRAELHERFVGWVEERMDGSAPDEIVGYHLEQAHRCYEELDRSDDARRTADAAAERLGAAGRRALARADARAAANLLQRAASLVPRASPARHALSLDAGTALTETGELARAVELLTEVIENAQAIGDRRTEFRARLAATYARALSNPEADFAALGSEARTAIDVFEELGDDAGLARAWHLAGLHAMWSGRGAVAEEALEHSLSHARSVGDEWQTTETLSWFSGALYFGPRPAHEVERLLAEKLILVPGNWKVEAWFSSVLAGVLAMQGRFAAARARADRAKALVDELGPGLEQAWMSHFFGSMEQLQDHLPAAEAELWKGYEISKGMGETGYLSTTAAILADVLCAQGRTEEALRLSQEAEATGVPDDVVTQVLWRVARAKAFVRLGRLAEGECLAREAVARARGTENLNQTADAIAALSDTLLAAGRTEEATDALRDAGRLYERKGNVVMATRMRDAVGLLTADA